MLVASNGGMGGSMVGPAIGGAVAGGGAVAAATWAKKVSSTAMVGLGLGIVNTGVSVVGGNANNTVASNLATLANTINGRSFAGANPTAAEAGALKTDMAQLAIYASQIASNTDPATVIGLRNAPTLPIASTAYTPSTVPAPVSTTPASGLGNLGVLALIGLAVYLVAKD